MTLLRLVSISIAALLLGCAATYRTPEDFVARFGGELSEYRRVAALTDCDELANEQARGANNLEDTGDERWQGHYEAAYQRFVEVGCT